MTTLLSVEPGQEILDVDRKVVKEVPVARAAALRAARVGQPSPETLSIRSILQLLDAGARLQRWGSSTPAGLRSSIQLGHGRRKLTFWPRIEGVRVAARGRSSSQTRQWWASITGTSPYTVTAELGYADFTQGRPPGGLVLEDVQVTSLTPGVTATVLSSDPNFLRFTVPNGECRSILLHITGRELRGYGEVENTDPQGSPAQLNEFVELLLP